MNATRRTLGLWCAVVIVTACAPRGGSRSALLDPDPAELAQRAPDTFKVRFETSRGPFVVQAMRAWAPNGVDRFHYLVRHGFYDGVKFFRVVPGFVTQFGIHGDPAISEVWRERRIPDDSVRQSNQTGFLTFAMGGPNSRTTQLFINRRDNRRLDAMGFAPIGLIVEGQSAADSIYDGYGEGPPRGAGPEQGMITRQGNAYLTRDFPRLDSIVRARVIKD
jgi:cyclophilin family peptidyl-prolyl cis-trans isomerase